MFAALRASSRNEGRIVAFDERTGEPVWERTVGDWRTDLVGGEVLYAAVGQSGGTGGVGGVAFDPVDGTRRWTYDLPLVNGATLHEGTLYAVAGRGDYTGETWAPEGSLVALDASSGEEQWRREAEQYGAHPPAVGDGRVYVASDFTPGEHGDFEGLMLAYTTDGEPVWRYRMGEDNTPAAPPVYEDGTLYVGGDRLVLAFEERDC